MVVMRFAFGDLGLGELKPSLLNQTTGISEPWEAEGPY